MELITHLTGADVEDALSRSEHPICILNEAPFVSYIDGFVSNEDSTHLIGLAASQMRRAVVAGADGGTKSAGRTNSVDWIPHAATPQTLKVAQAVARLLGAPLSHAENFQVIHYQPGAEYRPHFDAFDIATSRGLRTLQLGGQRITTTLCYLNSVEAGGATAFDKLGLRVMPQPGRLVVFNNCIGETSQRSPDSLHAGCPVEAGEKWAFNLWFREYPLTHNPITGTSA